MGRIEDLRRRYDDVRRQFDEYGDGDVVLSELREWAAGDVALEHFGRTADSLDVLCLVDAVARSFPVVIADQVLSARSERHSWSQIGAALGVSRQAARKRFGHVDADVWFDDDIDG